jgi:hypothetical protein
VSAISSQISPAADEQPTAAGDLRVDILNDPDPEAFRREYIDRCRPCIIRLSPDRRPPQFS